MANNAIFVTKDGDVLVHRDVMSMGDSFTRELEGLSEKDARSAYKALDANRRLSSAAAKAVKVARDGADKIEAGMGDVFDSFRLDDLVEAEAVLTILAPATVDSSHLGDDDVVGGTEFLKGGEAISSSMVQYQLKYWARQLMRNWAHSRSTSDFDRAVSARRAEVASQLIDYLGDEDWTLR